MSLSESIIYDKIEIVGEYKSIQVRKNNLVKKNNEIIASNFHRYVLNPGTLDNENNFIDNPLDKEPDGTTAIPDDIKAICNLVWTTEVKNAYKAILIANKNNLPS